MVKLFEMSKFQMAIPFEIHNDHTNLNDYSSKQLNFNGKLFIPFQMFFTRS